MKTSTVLATLAVICSFTGITAVNLKLKSEYDKGHLQEPFKMTATANFHYIKDNSDTSILKRARFEVQVKPDLQPGVGLYKETESQFILHVENDTLFISPDPAYKKTFSNHQPVIIHAQQLNHIDLANSQFIVNLQDVDTLSAILRNASTLSIDARKIRKLSVEEAGSAETSVTVKDSIGRLDLVMGHHTKFTANDLEIGSSSLQVGAASSLKLTGRSIKNFGVAAANTNR